MREDLIGFATPDGTLPFSLKLCGTSYCDGSYRINRPCSKIAVIEYIYEGEGTVIIDAERFIAKAGDVYFLPGGKDHLYYSSAKSPWVKSFMNMEGALTDELRSLYGLGDVYHIKDCDISAEFEALLQNAAKADKSDPEKFLQFATITFHKMVLTLHQTMKRDRPGGDAERIRMLLEGSVGAMPTLSDIAAQMGCSVDCVIKKFRAFYGITPYEYLLQRKEEMACYLLENTSLTVAKIALQLGYQDAQYFSGWFKGRKGMPPGTFRRQKKNMSQTT